MTAFLSSLTPEQRAEVRALVAEGVRAGREGVNAIPYHADSAVAGRIVPEPAPPLSYGREIKTPWAGYYRRRSDGVWEHRSDGVWEHGGWSSVRYDDATLRRLAAEVPLTDAECEDIGESVDWAGDPKPYRARIRAAVVRVLRGEVG